MPRCSHFRPNCDSIFQGSQFGSRLGVAVAFGTRFGSDLEKVQVGFESILASKLNQAGPKMAHNLQPRPKFGMLQQQAETNCSQVFLFVSFATNLFHEFVGDLGSFVRPGGMRGAIGRPPKVCRACWTTSHIAKIKMPEAIYRGPNSNGKLKFSVWLLFPSLFLSPGRGRDNRHKNPSSASCWASWVDFLVF